MIRRRAMRRDYPTRVVMNPAQKVEHDRKRRARNAEKSAGKSGTENR